MGVVWTLVHKQHHIDIDKSSTPTCKFDVRSDKRTGFFCFAKHIFILVIYIFLKIAHLKCA